MPVTLDDGAENWAIVASLIEACPGSRAAPSAARRKSSLRPEGTKAPNGTRPVRSTL